MQNRLIQASYVWNEEEFMAASCLVAKHTEGLIVKICVLFWIVIIGFVAFFLLTQVPNAGIGGVFLLALAAWFVYMFLSRRQGAGISKEVPSRRVLNQADQKVVLLFDDRWIRITTAGSEQSFVWELVPTVLHIPEGFLVKCGGVHRWIPNHSFHHEDDIDVFAQLASGRATKFIRKV